MRTDRKQYETLYVNIDELKIHRYANLLPMMDEQSFVDHKDSIEEKGLLRPIDVVLENGELYILDGRNRTKAMRELGKNKIKANIYENLSEKEKLDIVSMAENRRHQSAGSLAVSSWNYMNEEKKLGNNVNQRDAAASMGADYRLVSLVNKIYNKHKRGDIIQLLSEGKKINIGESDDSPYMTDNLKTIDRWILKQASRIKTTEPIQSLNDDILELTLDEEVELTNIIEHSRKLLRPIALKALNNRLYAFVKEMENVQ